LGRGGAQRAGSRLWGRWGRGSGKKKQKLKTQLPRGVRVPRPHGGETDPRGGMGAAGLRNLLFVRAFRASRAGGGGGGGPAKFPPGEVVHRPYRVQTWACGGGGGGGFFQKRLRARPTRRGHKGEGGRGAVGRARFPGPNRGRAGREGAPARIKGGWAGFGVFFRGGAPGEGTRAQLLDSQRVLSPTWTGWGGVFRGPRWF